MKQLSSKELAALDAGALDRAAGGTSFAQDAALTFPYPELTFPIPYRPGLFAPIVVIGLTIPDQRLAEWPMLTL